MTEVFPMSVHQELAAALRELEATMRATGEWRMDPPEPAAFASIEPFCADTMSLPASLRFVFIVRLEALVEPRAPMAANGEVAAAVPAWLAEPGARASERQAIIHAVAELD